MRSIPPLNALRAFESAARHQNIGRAAEELCVTSAAVSQQIKGLESYLGVDLFHRVGRRVVMTQQAQVLLPELKEAFALIEKSISRLGDSETGVLTVSASLAFTAKWLLPRIHKFQEQYPHIDIRIDANDRITHFAEEDVDAAIRFGPGDYAELVSLPLPMQAREKIIPVCSPALLQDKPHPLKRPEDLQFHTLLHDDCMARDGQLPTWAKWLSDAGFYAMDTLRGIHFNNSVLAIEAALNGQGVALGCAFVLKDDLKAGHLVQPFASPYETDYSYHLVFPERRINKKIEYFYNWLLQVCSTAQR